MFYARLLPYDGTQHLLATGLKEVRRPIPHAELDSVIANVVAEVHRQAATDRVVRAVHVNAPDPSKPVTATIIFAEGRPHFIADCFALAASDAAFANVLGTTMTAVAGSAGFPVV